MTATATALATATVLAPASPASAAPVELHSQRDTGIGRVSQTVPAPDAAFTAHGADDFVVPPFEVWEVTEVAVDGSSSLDRHGTNFRVRIYDGATEPTNVVSSQIVAAQGAGSEHIFPIAPVLLEPGRYWVSVVAGNGSLADPWFWSRYDVADVELPAMWENPGDGYGTGCTTWTAVTACPANALSGNLSFSIKGELIDLSDPVGSCAAYLAAGPQPGDVQGTPGHDVLLGTPGDDVIWGLAGHDRIFGMGGNDVIIGGLGDDTLDGGDGYDLLCGNEGRDVLIGGNDIDGVAGGVDDDRIAGGGADDNLRGEDGNDRIDGQSGTGNAIDGGAGTDFCANPTAPAALNCP